MVLPSASGTFNYSIPLTGSGCSGVNATGTITVTPDNTAGAASSTETLCINTLLTNITHATTGATGIGAATGLPAGVTAAWAANTITISGTPTASGTFNYNIPLTGGCGTVSATGTIIVHALPTVSLTLGDDESCVDETSVTLSGGSPAGGTYSGTGVSGTTFNAATAGVGTHTITYTYSDGNGCKNTATDIITVYALPIVSITGATEICILGGSTLSPTTGGTWVSNDASATVTNSGVVSGVSAGSATFTFTKTSTGCSATTGSITIIADLVATCAADPNLAACTSAADILSAYNTWVSGFSYAGGSDVIDNIDDIPALGDLTCGGVLNFTYTVENGPTGCQDSDECTTTFTVADAPAVVVVPITAGSTGSCQTQTAVDAAYATWFGGLSITGGCNLVPNIVNPGAPAACGGSATVTWAPTSDCETTASGSATFTVADAPAVVVVPITAGSTGSCQTQTAVDAAYATWFGGLSITGGCNLVPNIVNPGAPAACGGSATVTWAQQVITVSDVCYRRRW